MQQKNQGGIVAVIVVALIGVGFWYYDAQKPKNKIQGTWNAAVNGMGVGVEFNNGKMELAMCDGANCVQMAGRYHFISENTMSVSMDRTSVSDRTGTVGVNTATAAPFLSGVLTVVSVDSSTLVLRDEAGEYIRFRRA